MTQFVLHTTARYKCFIHFSPNIWQQVFLHTIVDKLSHLYNQPKLKQTHKNYCQGLQQRNFLCFVVTEGHVNKCFLSSWPTNRTEGQRIQSQLSEIKTQQFFSRHTAAPRMKDDFHSQKLWIINTWLWIILVYISVESRLA